MTDLVQIQNNRVVVSSKQVAKRFGKLHKDVLESIRQILVAENSATNFYEETTFDYRGRKFPIYLMDKDGFSLLVMGFTGKEALEWKIKYIKAFNAMEQEIQHKEYQASLAKSSENELLRKKVEQLKKDKFDISIQVDLAIRERRNLETELEIQEKVINNIKKAYIEKFEKDKNNITNTEMDEWNKMRLAQLEVYIKSVIEAVKIRGSIGMKDIQRINKFVDDLI
ncbi:Rha family transcriptional regulator [Megamonas funiformis]|jgi:Rha family phage regulatory protein|uniref:Rha family transcriptional regulator n=1 Tax=Megamonas funiformis TaxID=437897 RepID=UPI0022E0E4E8|nr:Rha family transcriptional regulator [Megamonas funiformis]